jgi:transmembrane sensor
MTNLRTPVKGVLRTTTTRASVVRMWNRIEARERARSSPPLRRVWLLAAAAAVLAVSTAFAVGWRATPGRHATEQAAARRDARERAEGPVARTAPSDDGPALAPASPPLQAPPAPAAAPPPARSTSVRPVERVEGPGDGWRALAARGNNEDAYAALGRGGVAEASRTAPVDDLFALADVARLSGHPWEAAPPLERILAEHSSDPRAPLAALTLGRVQLRSLEAPAAAARSVRRALALRVPAGLTEDAYALLVESLSRAGDAAGARAAYAQFLERAPGSERAAELRRWLRDP